MEFTSEEKLITQGRQGPALEFAMNLMIKAGTMQGATRLQSIECVHVGTTFAVIQTHQDLVSWLVEQGAKVAVPTFTNVGIADRDNPGLRPTDEGKYYALKTREVISLHRKLGCEMSLTCAPYQLSNQPRFGAHCAMSESNAISYFNSVVGARTQKYGDYLDLAAALTGKVPYAGLHTDEGRRGQVLIEIDTLPEKLASDMLAFQLIGHAVGRIAVTKVAVIDGLYAGASLDHLRCISAAAASSGGVTFYHAVGLTPEAPTLEAAFGDNSLPAPHLIGLEALTATRDELTHFEAGPINAVVLGTPPASLSEVDTLAALMSERRIKDGVTFYIQMNRHVYALAHANGSIETLRTCGVTPVLDTCTYWRPVASGLTGKVVTNSAKYAYYAPGEIGVQVAIASLEECVESAVRGELWRDPALGFH